MKSGGPATAASRLANGLRVVVIALPGTHRVVLTAALRAGPAFESKNENGISHFLEHMLYRGIPSAPSAHEQAEAFENLGGTLVATTYVDHGTIAVGVPAESFGAVVDRFAEAFTRPLFAGIEIEKGIVREEMLEGLDDDGNLIDADELARAACFPRHPLGFPIVGTMQRLEQVGEAALRRAHARFYAGDNAVLAVAGPIRPERVLPQLERAFSRVPCGIVPEPTPLGGGPTPGLCTVHDVANQTALRVVFRAPAECDPLEPASEILLRIIDDGMSTRLYHRICDELGLCYDVSAGYESYVNGGIFDFAAEAAHERAPRVLTEIFQMVGSLAGSGPTQTELDKARTRLRWNLEAMLDDPAEMASFHATGVLAGVLASLPERREQLLAVSLADVRRAAERIFRRDNVGVVAVGGAKRRERRELERVVQKGVT